MQDGAETLLENTILKRLAKHDIVTASYVESREATWDAAAADIIWKLQAAGVKRGQVLSIDAHHHVTVDERKEAVFSAHYSLEMADEGPLEVDFKAMTSELTNAAENKELATVCLCVCVCVCLCVCERARARVRARERERASSTCSRLSLQNVRRR